MAQLPMYAAMINSPGTELAADITATDTEITVLDASKLPAAPNLVTVGGDETAETIRYTGKTGNTLTGCTRGFEGTAKGWAAGTQAARNHTAYDYEAGRANIADVNTRVDNIVIPDGTTTQKGIVQLSDATNGLRSTVAATEKAVNDARTSVDGKIGNLANLNTADKSNVVAALNEVFTHVGDGKNLIESAVIVKGGTVAGTSPHSFAELADGIETIETATKINGQFMETVTYNGAINAYDPIYTKQSIGNAITPPNDLTTGRGVAFSPDGKYLAALNITDPKLLIYKVTGGLFELLNTPDVLPAAAVISCKFSPDGTYLAVSVNTTPYLMIYKRSGDIFTNLPNPLTLPTGSARAVSFSSESTYLAVAHFTSPFVTIYKRSGDNFTKLPNPTVLPPESGYSVSFSPDDAHLVVGHTGGSCLTIYKRSGDTFTKLADPATVPPVVPNSIDFGSDGAFLAVGLAGAPFILMYKRSGDIFTKLSDPSVVPTGAVNGVSFNMGATLLAVAHNNTPFVTIYNRVGEVFTKIANPSTLPANNGISAAFSSLYLVVANAATAPSLCIYASPLTAYKSNNFLTNAGQVSALGYVLESGTTGDKKDAILIWRS